MQFISTRSGMEPASFTDILLDGLAPDGGLVVPVGECGRFSCGA
ncbi:hypothetical protein R6G99_11695, partial [Actinotignum timonense]|nr:hypothetical protein [Actinotignum timonense]